MDKLYTVLIKFLPVLLLILLGVLIRRRKLLKRETIQELKTVIIDISLPALLILTFANTTFELRYALLFVTIPVVCLVMLALGTGLSKKLAPGNRYYPAVFGGVETGMLGYALYTAFFGAENTYKLAILDLGHAVFIFFILVSYLQKKSGSNIKTKRLVLNFVKSPIILAIVAGIIFSVTGLTAYAQKLQVTDAFVTALKLLGSLTQPLICIVLGYELQIGKSSIIRPLITVLVRMGLMLFAAFIIIRYLIAGLLRLDGSFQTALYMMFLLPPPFIIPLYIDKDAEKDKNEILNVISIHIVLTLAAFMVLASVTG